MSKAEEVEDLNQQQVTKPKGKFLPGQSGNPAGRPKGVRHKLSKSFLQDLAGFWQEEGGDIIRRVAADDPGTVLRVIASLVPKEIIARMELDTGESVVKDITPEDLAAVARIRQAMKETPEDVIIEQSDLQSDLSDT